MPRIDPVCPQAIELANRLPRTATPAHSPFEEIIKLCKAHRQFVRDNDQVVREQAAAAMAVEEENVASQGGAVCHLDLREVEKLLRESGAERVERVQDLHVNSAAPDSGEGPRARKFETRNSNDESNSKFETEGCE